MVDKLKQIDLLALTSLSTTSEDFMPIKVAINGFGRIGRNILRSAIEYNRKDIEIIAINDLAPVETNAHLLKYDSIYGKFPGKIIIDGDIINVGLGPIQVTNLRNPKDLPWADVDIVLECTGIFTSKEQASNHLNSGARKVLVSAPSSDADKTIVYGVNHKILGPDDIIVSNASCTTNCLAPVVKVLDELVGIKKGFMTTIHSYTGDQPTLDRGHSDFYRARAAALNMIPTSTGAARAVGLVLPQLEGKLDGVSIRVPTPNVSCVDLTFEAAQNTSTEEINSAIHSAASGALAGILGVTDEKLVSMDFIHDSRSSIFATDQTKVMGGNFCRILTWYDNEWGFSTRMLDTAAAMGKLM